MMSKIRTEERPCNPVVELDDEGLQAVQDGAEHGDSYIDWAVMQQNRPSLH